MRSVGCAIVVLFFILFPDFRVSAEERNMVVEVYPLALADFDASIEIARGLVSPEGKLVEDRPGNRLIVLDYPEKQAELRIALKTVGTPQYNVRIEVTFDDNGEIRSDAIGVQGGFRVGHIQAPSELPHASETHVEINRLEESRAAIVHQELLVMSGSRGRLRVGTDVPYADWFWNYGTQLGLWSGALRWKELGAQMAVEPYVLGQRIRLRLTPEFSYMLDGESMTTSVEKLMTELWVQNGEEVDLGGISASDREFFSRFLVGYNRLGEKHSLRIKVKPTIEPIGPAS